MKPRYLMQSWDYEVVYCQNELRYVINVQGKTYVYNIEPTFDQLGARQARALWM